MWVERPHNVAQYTPSYLPRFIVGYIIQRCRGARPGVGSCSARYRAPLRRCYVRLCAARAHRRAPPPPVPPAPRRPARRSTWLWRCEAMPLPCRRLFGLHNAIESLRSTRLADRTFPTSSSERRYNNIAVPTTCRLWLLNAYSRILYDCYFE